MQGGAAEGWRGEDRVMLTADVAGATAPPILARQWRALIRGAAEPNKWRTFYFRLNGGLEYYEWELRLGGKLCLGTMGYGLEEDISLILSMLRLII